MNILIGGGIQTLQLGITLNDSFLLNLRRSRLLEPEALAAIEEDLWAEGMEHESGEVIADLLVQRGELTRWQADRLLAGRFRGFQLGDYLLLDLLGKGGMGSVYLAEHRVLKCRLAVKVLQLGSHEQNKERIEWFRREAETLSSLNHENIIGALEVHTPTEDCDQTFLVMELVEGKTFAQVVADHGPLDIRRTVAWLIQACRGLHHLHRQGFVHRDIKPANLMVRRTGQVLLLDLGLANSPEQASGDDIDAKKAFIGTADFVSPEQARNNQRIDARSDLYSLGCTAYFLLTGRPPFEEQSVASRLVAHQMYQPRSLAELRPDLPAGLVTIINRMMAKDAADRFTSASGVEDALHKFFRTLPDSGSVEIPPSDRAAERAMTRAPAPSAERSKVTFERPRFWTLKAMLGMFVSWFSLFSMR